MDLVDLQCVQQEPFSPAHVAGFFGRGRIAAMSHDDRKGQPQFSLKVLLLGTTFVAMGTLLGKWLLHNVAAQLVLALLSAITLLLLAGYWIGSGVGYAYGNSQRGGMIGATIMLFFIVIAGCLIAPLT
jgi:hypothetical protein